MPLDKGGKYVWLSGSGERYAYLYAEGALRSTLPPDVIHETLASLFESESAVQGDFNAYRVPDALVFELFLVRADGRCALIATTPVQCDDSSLSGRLEQMAREVNALESLVSSALQSRDDRADARFEWLDCQMALAY